MATPCLHDACYCDSDAIDGYCSESCRDQATSADSYFRCRCNHPDCREETVQGDDADVESTKVVYGG